MAMSENASLAPEKSSTCCCCFDCDDTGDDNVQAKLVITEGPLGFDASKFGLTKYGFDEKGKPYHVAFASLTGAGSNRQLTGSLEKGMLLFQINGTDMYGVSYKNAMGLAKKTRPVELMFVTEKIVQEDASDASDSYLTISNIGAGASAM
jgi:hypothetical protein